MTRDGNVVCLRSPAARTEVRTSCWRAWHIYKSSQSRRHVPLMRHGSFLTYEVPVEHVDSAADPGQLESVGRREDIHDNLPPGASVKRRSLSPQERWRTERALRSTAPIGDVNHISPENPDTGCGGFIQSLARLGAERKQGTGGHFTRQTACLRQDHCPHMRHAI
jgi:hypothetical protein